LPTSWIPKTAKKTIANIRKPKTMPTRPILAPSALVITRGADTNACEIDIIAESDSFALWLSPEPN